MLETEGEALKKFRNEEEQVEKEQKFSKVINWVSQRLQTMSGNEGDTTPINELDIANMFSEAQKNKQNSLPPIASPDVSFILEELPLKPGFLNDGLQVREPKSPLLSEQEFKDFKEIMTAKDRSQQNWTNTSARAMDTNLGDRNGIQQATLNGR